MKHLIDNIKEALEMPGCFCIIKPGFLNHEQEICSSLQDKGWTINKKKRLTLTAAQSASLYHSHKDKPFYDNLCKYMSSGPCICMSVQNTTCKSHNSEISSLCKCKEQFRQQWGKDDMKNVFHCSDSPEASEQEMNVIF